MLPRERFETVGSKLNLPKCSSNATAQAIAYLKLYTSHAKKKIVNQTRKPKDKIYNGYQNLIVLIIQRNHNLSHTKFLLLCYFLIISDHMLYLHD